MAIFFCLDMGLRTHRSVLDYIEILNEIMRYETSGKLCILVRFLSSLILFSTHSLSLHTHTLVLLSSFRWTCYQCVLRPREVTFGI